MASCLEEDSSQLALKVTNGNLLVGGAQDKLEPYSGKKNGLFESAVEGLFHLRTAKVFRINEITYYTVFFKSFLMSFHLNCRKVRKLSSLRAEGKVYIFLKMCTVSLNMSVC